MNVDRKMLIGLHLGNGYGSQSGAWLMDGIDLVFKFKYHNK